MPPLGLVAGSVMFACAAMVGALVSRADEVLPPLPPPLLPPALPLLPPPLLLPPVLPLLPPLLLPLPPVEPPVPPPPDPGAVTVTVKEADGVELPTESWAMQLTVCDPIVNWSPE